MVKELDRFYLWEVYIFLFIINLNSNCLVARKKESTKFVVVEEHVGNIVFERFRFL